MINILNILETLLDNEDKDTNFLLALSMYINFYYEHIVSEEKMMNYLVDSNKLIDKLGLSYPDYTRRQLESTYIAFTICIILLFINDNNFNDNNLINNIEQDLD
jgi:hypothetical protein